MNKTLLCTAVAAALTLSSGVAQAESMGKCYGVAEKGKNDCAAKDSSHSCGGQASEDHNKNDWKKMTKKDCDKVKGRWEETKDEKGKM